MTILFYDGVCGLCNRLVHFVVRRDEPGRLRYAALQSQLATELIARHGRDPRDLDTLYLLVDAQTPSERLLLRSRAVFEIFRLLGGPWRLLSLLRVLPAPLTDLGYRLIARLRYRLFGRYEACPLPPPEMRARFLDHTIDS